NHDALETGRSRQARNPTPGTTIATEHGRTKTWTPPRASDSLSTRTNSAVTHHGYDDVGHTTSYNQGEETHPPGREMSMSTTRVHTP
ncbi:ligand-gated channel protein, partial [Serratia liquefaciens]